LSDESIKPAKISIEGNKKFLGFRFWTLGLQPSVTKLSWSSAWKIGSFKWKFWLGMVIFAGILIALPYFFDAIEARQGYQLKDFILDRIRARNVSVAVFFLIWSSCLILVIRIYHDPMMMLVMLWAYNGVTLIRMACIGLISLNPPAGLIRLQIRLPISFMANIHNT
jgi:hypothetical protein